MWTKSSNYAYCEQEFQTLPDFDNVDIVLCQKILGPRIFKFVQHEILTSIIISVKLYPTALLEK